MAERFAFVFPGQGSQSVGMLADIAEQFSSVKATFDEASEALGYDMWALVQEGPEEELKKTEVTQPVMLVAGIAMWRAWLEKGGPKPVVMAGHSLGEYSALVAANAMAFIDAVRIVRIRGRSMQEAVPLGTGSMAAILGLDDDAIVGICKEVSTDAEFAAAANFNAPGQVVIGGHKAAVETAIEKAKEAGARKAMPVAMSAPSHCSLMQPSADRLERELQAITLQAPEIPVVNNVRAEIETDPASIQKALIEQVVNPVQWVKVVQKVIAQDVTSIAECGPGKVLSGLNKRIDKSVPTMPMQNLAAFEKAFAAISGE